MAKRYCPDLIAENNKILPNYFKESSGKNEKKNGLIHALSLASSIILFLCSPMTVAFFPFFFTIALTGTLLLPRVNRMLFKAWRLRPTVKVRVASLCFLVLMNVPFAIGFSRFRSEIIRQERIELLLVQKAAKAAEIREQQRVQTFIASIQRIETLRKDRKFSNAFSEIVIASSIAVKTKEIESLQRLRTLVSLPLAKEFARKGNHSKAIELLNDLYRIDTSNANVLYQRALCYSKTNRIPEAVHDAKHAKLLGNKDAEKLYEKLNPLRRYVAERVTLCNDGSYSYSTGRGTCSHHGGVATYNYPIYETYRKYD